MTATEAEQITRDVMIAVLEANKLYGFKLIFISRSDSTLRGHFPMEPDTIREVLLSNGVPVVLPTFFIPSFLEAGRFTIGQVHYLKDGNELIPVGETEFAKDNVFGYRSSNLSDYIIEKTGGLIKRDRIGWISLDTIRNSSLEQLSEAIKALSSKTYITIDAFDYSDLHKFSAVFLTLFSKLDTCAVLRTSSSLPKALSGISDIDLLNHETLVVKKGTGLFVVGSHVKKSTIQLQNLLNSSKVQGLEINIDEVLKQPEKLLNEVLDKLKHLEQQGLTPVIYTSRQELRLTEPAKRLKIGQTISAFLVNIVKNLPYKPTYIVAKGGITSHDILTKGLGIETASIMGQILPGVPVLKTDAYNLYPNMPYIIFPGNVGDEEALRTLLDKLS